MTFDVYITDLKDEIREQLINTMGWNGNENYDVIPLFTIQKEEEE